MSSTKIGKVESQTAQAVNLASKCKPITENGTIVDVKTITIAYYVPDKKAQLPLSYLLLKSKMKIHALPAPQCSIKVPKTGWMRTSIAETEI